MRTGKKRKKEKTIRMPYHQKELDKMNLMALRKTIIKDGKKPHAPPKGSGLFHAPTCIMHALDNFSFLGCFIHQHV
jgi:hypothetical protein